MPSGEWIDTIQHILQKLMQIMDVALFVREMLYRINLQS